MSTCVINARADCVTAAFGLDVAFGHGREVGLILMHECSRCFVRHVKVREYKRLEKKVAEGHRKVAEVC